MAGQYELSDKHLNCIKRTQDMISAVEEISARNDKNPKEKIKQYLSRSFGLLPSESEIYNDYLGMVVSLEEIAKKDSLSAYILADQITFRNIMKDYGKCKADEVLTKGETIGLLCLEPGFSTFKDIQTKAVKTQNGWQLSGVKLISSEQIYSDKYLIFAKDEESKIRLFTIIEEDIKITEIAKSISSSQIIINQAEISTEIKDENCVGVINDNFEKVLTLARTLIATIAVGIGHSALISSIQTAKETKNAQGESVSTSQNIQFTLADMFSELESGRMLTYYSADSIDKGKPSIKIASMAKVKASEAAAQLALETVHILGNIGFIANSDLTLIQMAMDSRVKGGTNRIQKAQIYEYMLAKK